MKYSTVARFCRPRDRRYGVSDIIGGRLHVVEWLDEQAFTRVRPGASSPVACGTCTQRKPDRLKTFWKKGGPASPALALTSSYGDMACSLPRAHARHGTDAKLIWMAGSTALQTLTSRACASFDLHHRSPATHPPCYAISARVPRSSRTMRTA